MSIEGRIESLKRKHLDLEARIEAMRAERVPDEYINTLKREKLTIKDELARILDAE